LLWILAPLVGQITRVLPNVIPQMLNRQTRATIEGIEKREFDLGLVRRGSVPATLKATSKGWSRELKFVIHDSLRNKLGLSDSEVLTIGEVSRAPLALLEGPGPVRELAMSEGVDLKCIAEGSSVSQLLALAENATCGCFVPDFVELEVSELRSHRIKKLATSDPVVVAYDPRRLEKRPIVQKVITLLESAASAVPR